ncbi:MAG TPA: energy transducer TonB, partial [Opitutaceae bacterium]
GIMGAKLQIGATAVIVVAGGVGYWSKAQDNTALRREIAEVQATTPVLAKMEQAKTRQTALAAEVEELRRDDAELAKLRDEVASLQKQRAARSEAAKARTRASESLGPGAVLYSLVQLDRQPVPTRQPPPTYPQALRASGERHEAVVEFAIDADGQVHDTKALRFTHPDIATAAVEGVNRWQFQPGEKDGAKVNVRMQMPIVFQVSKEVTKVEPWF